MKICYYRRWLLAIITFCPAELVFNWITGELDVKVRKQVYNLTLADFDRFPVWEFALDEEGEEGQDEATVRPFQFIPPLKPSDGLFVILSDFILADGTRMQGYLTPPAQETNDVRMSQPIIMTEHGQVALWYGILKPSAETISENYRLLNKTSAQVFPVRFKSTVEMQGGSIEGMLDGFLYFRRDESHPLRIKDTPIESVR
jgi:hypothetical protein